MEIIIIGQMDNTIDHTFESANRIYGTDGISPTIPTCAGGGIQPKIMKIKAIDRTTDVLEVNSDGTSNTITTAYGSGNKNIELNPMEDGTCRTIKNQYFKNGIPNFESHGTFGASGCIQIKQATKDGIIECDIGGGGGPVISGKQHQERKSNRKRTNKSNIDNGEYP